MRQKIVNRNLKLLFIFLVLGFPTLVYSGQPKLTKSSISDQLQQPTVSAIYRDNEGILWLGTQQGLYRYNGASLSTFNTDKTNQLWIPESDIKDIGEDQNGNLLVATSGGSILTWDKQAQKFKSSPETDTTESARLVRMLASRNGYVWLLYQKGLNLYDPESLRDANWVAELKIIDYVGIPQAIAEDKRGNLWIGGSKGIMFIDPQRKTFSFSDIGRLDLPSNSSITVLEVNDENNLVAGTNSGQLLVWDTSLGSIIAKMTIKEKGQTYISRLAMLEDKLVIGSDSGLYISDQRLSFISEVYGEGNRATNTDVYSLYRDGKYIWVGKINGLDILTFAPFELFNMENSGVSNHVIAFAQDDNDELWIGTYAGLYSFDDGTRTHTRSELNFNLDPLVPDDQRVVTLATQAGDLWVGLFAGGVRKLNISDHNFRSTRQNWIDGIAVTKILVDEKNGDIWVATFDHGLFRINSERTYSYLENKKLPEPSITSLFQSHKGLFLAVSGNRVYQYRAKTDDFHEIPFIYGLGNSRPLVYSINQSDKHDILFGTKDHGLFTWPRSDQIKNHFELTAAPNELSLATSTIYGIEIDSNNNLWCSTQNGVIKLSSQGKLIKRFTTADGLQGNDFTLGASFKSRQGLIYFGGINGYNRFDPNEIEIDSTPSPMRLTGVSLPTLDKRNLGDIADLKSLQLTHKDRFVTFQFSVLDFIGAGRNQFRYRLENFDTDWIENGTSNTATYTSLPAGQYIFRAQGANSAGIWNREGITLNVTVLPAPWFTWWAYTLYGLVSLCLFWGMHRIYRSYAIDKESALLAQEMFEADNKSDDDLQEQLEHHDELVRSAYQHNLTTLGLVGDSIRLRSTNLAEGVNRTLAERTMERISALFGLEDCLSYQAGGPVANLYEYTERILPALIERSPVSPESIVTVNEVTDLPIPAELASPISIILFELVENCIQHAFKPDSPANYIHIKLITATTEETGTTSYDLSVHDSGIGLSDSIEELARNGRGIAIVHFIASKIRAQIQVSQGSGTTIRLVIPSIDNP